MINYNKIISVLFLSLLVISCNKNKIDRNIKHSIYDYENDVILGDPIRITISESEQIKDSS